jgi:hypothetical protein
VLAPMHTDLKRMYGCIQGHLRSCSFLVDYLDHVTRRWYCRDLSGRVFGCTSASAFSILQKLALDADHSLCARTCSECVVACEDTSTSCGGAACLAFDLTRLVTLTGRSTWPCERKCSECVDAMCGCMGEHL